MWDHVDNGTEKKVEIVLMIEKQKEFEMHERKM